MTPQPLRVLGIDPGSRATGWGVVEQQENGIAALGYGAWKLRRRHPLPQRLKELYNAIAQVIASYSPHELAIEDFFVGHVRAAVTIGQVRAMALLAAAQAGIPVYLYRPLEVKRLVTGYGRGDKARVQASVQKILRLDHIPESDDAADALAVAIGHCFQRDLASKPSP